MGLRDVLKQNKGDAAIMAASIAMADNKAAALASAVKDVAIWKLVGPAGLVLSSFKGISAVVQTLVKDSGSLVHVFEKLRSIRALEDQFKVLLNNTQLAKTRVAELMQLFNSQRKFSFGDMGEAARELQILTRGAFTDLKAIADRAAATGNTLGTVAQKAGELHRALQDGESVKAVAGEMERLGILGGKAAEQLIAMQASGASAATVFAAFQTEIQGSTGALDAHARSADGIAESYARAKAALGDGFAAPWKAEYTASMADATAVFRAMEGPVKSLSEFLHLLISPFENLGTKTGVALARLGLLSPVLAAGTLAVKGLLVGLTAMGVALSVRALAPFVALMVKAFAATDRASVALAALKNSGTAASAAITQLRNSNTGLAAQAAAAAGSSLKQATAFGVAAAAGKVFGFVLRGLLYGTGLVLLITLLQGASEALADWWGSAERAAKAAADLAKENRDLENSLHGQIAAIRNLNGAQDALAVSTKALADARAKLHDIESRASGGDKNAKAQLPSARAHVAAMSAVQSSLKDGIRSGRFGVSEEQDAINRRRALRDVELAETGRRDAISRATGPARLVLMERERERMAADAAEGRAAEEERARLNDMERTRLAQARTGAQRGLVAYEMGEARRNSRSSIVQEEQRLQDMNLGAKGVLGREFAPGERQAQEAKLAFLRANITDRTSENERGTIAADSAIRDERKAQALARADLAAEREIAALRDRGFQREEQSAAARINALKEQRDVELDYGNELGASEIEPRIAAAERELRLAQERNALERQTIAARLAAAEAENAAGVAAARGQFAAADAALASAQAIRDAEDDRQALDGYRDKFGNDQQAGEALAKDQAARAAARAAAAETFRATKGRELEEGRLAASGTAEDARKLVGMQDVDEFRKAFAEASRALGPGRAAEASGFALQQTQQQIMMQQSPVVASAMARIGGGGGVADPTISVQQRIAAIAAEQRDLLKQLVEKERADAHPNVPAEYQWDD